MKTAVILLLGILAGNSVAKEMKPRKFTLLKASSQTFVDAPVQIGVVKDNRDRISSNLTKLRALVSSGKINLLLSDKQLEALILVETGGRAGLIGDKHLGNDPSLWAYGKLQLRKCYVDDVNRAFGTDILAADCLFEDELSILVTQAYMNLYAPNHSFEHRAKVHNGGPAGPKVPKTTAYWAKVQSKLALLK